MAEEQSEALWHDSLEGVVEPGEVLLGKYRLDRVIGVGGMGLVLEAWHVHFDEPVAVKLLLPSLGANDEALGRFEREAAVVYKVRSEHVPRIIDVGKLDSGVPFMVMELLVGKDLADLLEQNSRLPIDLALTLAVQACEALAAAHAAGVVHRDIKPENLFLTMAADGSPCLKVLDFGLSKLDESAREPGEPRQRALTGVQQAMGTPHYMSPEQWNSARDVGPAADQWALGVIVWELLAGQAPFDGPLTQLCSMILSKQPPSLRLLRPEVPAALEQVILRALQKQARDRYEDVGQFALALAPFAPPAAQHSVERTMGILAGAGASSTPSPRAPLRSDARPTLPDARRLAAGLTAPAPVSIAPVSLAPGSLAPGSLAPGSLAPGSLAPASLAPASLAPASHAPVSTRAGFARPFSPSPPATPADVEIAELAPARTGRTLAAVALGGLALATAAAVIATSSSSAEPSVRSAPVVATFSPAEPAPLDDTPAAPEPTASSATPSAGPSVTPSPVVAPRPRPLPASPRRHNPDHFRARY